MAASDGSWRGCAKCSGARPPEPSTTPNDRARRGESKYTLAEIGNVRFHEVDDSYQRTKPHPCSRPYPDPVCLACFFVSDGEGQPHLRESGEDAVDQGAGEEPCEDAGEDPGEDAVEDHGEDAGEDPGEDAGKDPGEDAGENADEDAGEDDGKGAGEDAGKNDGKDAEEDAGKEVGDETGKDAGTHPCMLPPHLKAISLKHW